MFRELAYAQTPLGELSLWLRTELKLGVEVDEIKLNEQFLMSSLFTVAEEELSRLGLAALDMPEMDVVVGGLGLGYTAKAALEDTRMRHPDHRFEWGLQKFQRWCLGIAARDDYDTVF